MMFKLEERVMVAGRLGRIVGITYERQPRHDVRFDDNGEIWINVPGRRQLDTIRKAPPITQRGQT
tara:strand:+ start:719 stop:913 length:195 start_codon:yes stop_codon:yes gene_type:complete